MSTAVPFDPARCCILSGADPIRMRSHVNHKIYATLHGHDYRFEPGPFAGLQNPYFLKIRAIEHVLPRYDWVLWIDDDAFFTDFSTSLFARLIPGQPADTFLFACRSPVGRDGKWTFLNSGVMLLRSGPAAADFLARVATTPRTEVRAAWDEARLGLFTQGEQVVIIHLLHRDGLLDRVRLFEPQAFNARPDDFVRSPEEHPVCHFAGGDKLADLKRFATRFGRDETLVPADLAERFGTHAPRQRPGHAGSWLPGRAAPRDLLRRLRRRLLPTGA